MTIRDFHPDDYAALVELYAATEPDYPVTSEELCHEDERYERGCRRRRWLAITGGCVVGMAAYRQSRGDARSFGIDVSVHPGYRRRGIGARLYDHVAAALAPLEPVRLNAGAQDDWIEGIAFLKGRGFVEESRNWESRLDLRSFDPAPYLPGAESLEAQGIRFRSLRELLADPACYARLHDLHCEVQQDVPRTEPHPPVPFAEFVDNVKRRPGRLPEAYLLAVDGDCLVGLTTLNASADPRVLETGLTGVRRGYRGRGIALALKVRNLCCGQSLGAAEVRTWNASNNRPMLAINERLGFRRHAAWIEFKKLLDTSHAPSSPPPDRFSL